MDAEQVATLRPLLNQHQVLLWGYRTVYFINNVRHGGLARLLWLRLWSQRAGARVRG